MTEPDDYSAPPVAPEACALSALDLECTDGVGEIPISWGGAGGLGGAGPVGEPSCILRHSAQLSCPSHVARLAVGRGSEGQLDVAVAQKGQDGLTEFGAAAPDTRLHLGTFRLGLEENAAEAREFEPTDGAERVTLAVVPGNEDGDALLALHRSGQHPEPGLDFLAAFSGGEVEASLDATGMGRPVTAAGPVGTRAYADLISSTVSLVDGLLDEPRRMELGPALAVALDYDDIGEPYVLVHRDGELRLLGGADHDELLWSETRGQSSDAELDLLVGSGGVPDRRALLVRDGQTTYPLLRVQEGSEAPATGSLARGSRGCDGWTLNVDCSECPVGTACENTDFVTRGARLFAFGERTLVAVHWSERVQSRVTDTDTSLLGICVCDSTLVETAQVAEYLSVYDIGYRGPETALDLALVFEQQLGDGDDVGDFGFARDAEDGVDFWYGPYLTQPESSLARFPDEGRRYIIERLGGNAEQ